MYNTFHEWLCDFCEGWYPYNASIYRKICFKYNSYHISHDVCEQMQQAYVYTAVAITIQSTQNHRTDEEGILPKQKRYIYIIVHKYG